MNNLTPEQLAFRAGYEQGRFDAQVEAAQQRHISYVCPQCHWSLDKQPAQQQEPVAWITRRTADGGVYVGGYETCESTDYGAIPVYTTPPAQQQWVGLTDEEMHACWDSPLTPLGMKHVRMIEAKLKEKNNG